MTKPELPIVYLKPGEIFVSDEPSKVTTVLGSCVSVTMYASRLRLGAICHGLLPSCRGKSVCEPSCLEGLRFVDCSIRRMVWAFRQKGIDLSEIDVKVFGGGDVLGMGLTGNKPSVGFQNIEIALRTLEQEGLRILASDVGGARGRKLHFYTHTGEVFLKRLNRRVVDDPFDENLS